MRDESSFSDAEVWTDLAKEAGVRLPQWRTPCTTGKMKWYLEKIGTNLTWYMEYHQARSLKQFVIMNPEWPLRAWLGVQLELIDWEKNHECPENLTSNPSSGPVSVRQSRRATTKTSS